MTTPSPAMDSTSRNNPPYLTTGQAPATADDAPPPPYSETDIYSTSSQPPHSPHAGSVAGSGHGPAAPGDDTASRMSSTSTTEPIFTPPLTPRTESNVNATTPTTHEIPLSPSVALYFETRPVPTSASQWEPQIHSIAVKPTSVPDDIPYPENWATSYDITAQDWATFVNFLLPDHDSVRNEAILGEKGKSEDGSDIKSSIGDGSVKSERHTTDPNELRRKRAEVEAIVQQWNSGFFAPRNVMVRLQPEEQSHMPGGWETTFDDPPVQLPHQAGPSSPREAMPQRRPSGWTGSWGGFQDQQLPVYIARLQQWTTNPLEVRSKADVKQLKAELKASNTNGIAPNIDRKALKLQGKALSQQWKTLKRGAKEGGAMLSQFLLLWCLLSKFLPFMFPQSTFTFLLSTSLVSEFLHQLSVAGDGQAEEPAEEIEAIIVEAEVEVGAVVKVKVPGAEVEEASKEAGQTTVHLDLPVEAVSLVAENANKDGSIPPPGAASAAKYNTVFGIETEIATKQKDLEVKEITLSERRALEKEIEALTETMERTRLEADEAYARELAEQLDG
ncbi:hypothetical protein FoTM2_005892 [Fusarium oxysporum f. sp. vasinfectum]|nr:hypothetical protein FoTM2_005892 [Fusarium oxysporum f. sp. vasinfectum]